MWTVTGAFPVSKMAHKISETRSKASFEKGRTLLQ